MSQAPTTVLQEINGLYVALYGRAADSGGFTYWIGALMAHDPAVTLADTLPSSSYAISAADATWLGQQFVAVASSYFNSLYNNPGTPLTPTQFVEALYQNIGGNSGDPTGITYWSGLLTAAEGGSPTQAQIQTAESGIVGLFVQELLGINLYPVSATDATANAAALGLTLSDYNAAVARQQEFQNKVTVSEFYADLSLLPGGSVLAVTSTSGPAFTAAQDIIAGVTNNASTVIAAEDAVVAAINAQPPSLTPILTLSTTPGQTFTLTTGVDAPGIGVFAAPTAGLGPITGNNNLVVGTYNGTGATYNPGDQIIGPVTGTGNALTLYDLVVTATPSNPTNIAGITVSNIQTLNIVSGEAVTANTASSVEGFSGLTALNVSSSDNGAAVDTITAGATTAIQVTDVTTAGVIADLTVTGGSTITISEANGGNSNSGQAIAVNSGTGTIGVSVTQTETSPSHDQSVFITDANYAAGTTAGVITSVTLNGLDNRNATIYDSALANLIISNVAAAGAAVTITEGAYASPATTLNLRSATTWRSPSWMRVGRTPLLPSPPALRIPR